MEKLVGRIKMRAGHSLFSMDSDGNVECVSIDRSGGKARVNLDPTKRYCTALNLKNAQRKLAR